MLLAALSCAAFIVLCYQTHLVHTICQLLHMHVQWFYRVLVTALPAMHNMQALCCRKQVCNGSCLSFRVGNSNKKLPFLFQIRLQVSNMSDDGVLITPNKDIVGCKLFKVAATGERDFPEPFPCSNPFQRTRVVANLCIRLPFFILFTVVQFRFYSVYFQLIALSVIPFYYVCQI